MDWIHVTQDRDQWQVLVSMAMNLKSPLKIRNLTDATIMDFASCSYKKPCKNVTENTL
jgi:hypothetical protein